jgi:hypothetical protein
MNCKDLSKPEMMGEPIETVTFRVNDLENGILNYVEAHFKTPYISRLNMTMLGFVSSFRFAKYETSKKELDKEDMKRMKVKSVQELAELSKRQLPK